MAEFPFSLHPPAVSRNEHFLVLAPAASDGWFDGRTITAHSPAGGLCRCTMTDAAEQLDATFRFSGDGLTAALIMYEGDAFVAHYTSYSVPDLTPEIDSRRRGSLLAEVQCDFSGASYSAAVDKTRDRIARGDVYVLNLTGRITGTPVTSPWDSFLELHQRARGKMSAFFGSLDAQLPTIASVSPERFFRIRTLQGERRIDIRPIKGTRPRETDGSADVAGKRALSADPKELAEHLMVVDLIRNDIGRISAPGTVRVHPFMHVETTPYCHQLVSGVHGVVRGGASLAEVLASIFPCGSITGAPKLAAMRIADELEPSPRGAYCGTLIVAIHGHIDASVLIRTLEWTSPDRAQWGTGCGITYDSDPTTEWSELQLKAQPVLGAAEFKHPGR
ncbi:MAG: anthranilate synthase component I family protein [Actinobacteria bacterium]|nr:MAG: anthranilate synthase component I family protein [Actinomycetota bacterium]